MAPTQPCATIRAGQDRFNLGSGEKLKLPLSHRRKPSANYPLMAAVLTGRLR